MVVVLWASWVHVVQLLYGLLVVMVLLVMLLVMLLVVLLAAPPVLAVEAWWWGSLLELIGVYGLNGRMGMVVVMMVSVVVVVLLGGRAAVAEEEALLLLLLDGIRGHNHSQNGQSAECYKEFHIDLPSCIVLLH